MPEPLYASRLAQQEEEHRQAEQAKDDRKRGPHVAAAKRTLALRRGKLVCCAVCGSEWPPGLKCPTCAAIAQRPERNPDKPDAGRKGWPVAERVVWHDEDQSRLRYEPGWSGFRYIYEPLQDLVTSEELRPYCYLGECVGFYDWRSDASQLVFTTKHRWSHGDVVESGGLRFELQGACCVHRLGQWAMRWSARRTDKPLWVAAEWATRNR